MTEREYIIATDLRALSCAIDCLNEITPRNNPIIAIEEWQRAIEYLVVLRGKSYEAIKIE